VKIFKKDLWAKPLIALLTSSTDALDGVNDAISIYDASAGEERRISPDNAAKRLSWFYLTAAGCWASKTNGATAGTDVEMATNKQTLQCYDFDKDTEKYIETNFCLPNDYDGGTVRVKFIWTCTGGASNGTVIWGAKAVSYSNDDAIDQAYGTAQEVSDDWIADYDVHVTSFTSALTIANTPAAGDLVHWCFYRKAADGSDDLGVSARLIGIVIEYGINKWSM
jgi:hypothetical protein